MKVLNLKVYMWNGKVTLSAKERKELENFVEEEDIPLIYHVIWNYFTNELIENTMSMFYKSQGRNDMITVTLPKED